MLDNQHAYLASADPETIEDPIVVASNTTASSDPNETIFEITGVPPGSYYLYPLWNPGNANIFSGWVTSRTAVTVIDHDVDGLDIVLQANREIQGRVIANGNISPVAMKSLRVVVRRKERLPTLLLGLISPSLEISDAGAFTMPNMPNTRLAISMTGLPDDAYVADVRQEGRSVFDEGVVPGGADKPVEITIATDGGSLRGNAFTAATVPAARATVTLVPAQRRGNPQFYKRTTTDANGQFTIRGIAPGEYKVFAWVTPPPGQAEESAEFLAPYEARGTALNVAAGSAGSVRLSVINVP